MIHTSVVLGLLVAAFLWINQFPDYHADKSAGKRNLVVRLGRDRAVTAYIALVLTAYAYLALASVRLDHAQGIAWGLVGLLPTGIAIRRLLNAGGRTREVVPAQAATLLGFIVMGIASGAGYLWSGH